MTDESTKPVVELRWTKPIVLASLAVLTGAVFFGFLFPNAKRAIVAGVLISPIPPVP